MAATGVIDAVCTGTVERFTWQGREGTTAIRKAAVDGPRRITVDGVEGDTVANPDAHGAPLRAVYAYATEDVEPFERQLDRALPPGSFGENLRLRGVDASGARPGERWRVGEALLEVTTIRTPCWKFAWAMGEEGWERRFRRAGRPGAYLTVVEEGVVAAGDPVRVVRERLDHDVTLTDVHVASFTDRRLRATIREQLDALPPAVAADLRHRLR